MGDTNTPIDLKDPSPLRPSPLREVRESVARWDGLDEHSAGRLIAEILARLEEVHGRPVESLSIITDPNPYLESNPATPIHRRQVVVTLRTMMHSVWVK